MPVNTADHVVRTVRQTDDYTTALTIIIITRRADVELNNTGV